MTASCRKVRNRLRDGERRHDYIIWLRRKGMKEKMKKVLKSNKGFTMIELMVVIVIMLILAAIAIPSFNTLIAKANTTAATAEARTVLTLAQLQAEMDEIEDGEVPTEFKTDDWTAILEDAGVAGDENFGYLIDDGTVYVCYYDGNIFVALPDDGTYGDTYSDIVAWKALTVN